MPLPTDERIRAMAAEILAQRKYARWHHQDVTAGWLRWVARELASWHRWIAELAEHSPLLFAGLLTLLTLVALALLGHVGWTVRQALRREPAVPAVPEPATPPAEAAERLATRGRFLDAARLMQLAVLEQLGRRRLVTLSAGESNAVLTARLATAPLPDHLGERAVALVRDLERRWFGDRQEDAALYAAWVSLHGDLTAALP